MPNGKCYENIDCEINSFLVRMFIRQCFECIDACFGDGLSKILSFFICKGKKMEQEKTLCALDKSRGSVAGVAL